MSAEPRPYQAGSPILACCQAKTHGMARSDSMPGAGVTGSTTQAGWESRRGGSALPRRAGRDPRAIAESSVTGVAARKNSGNPGSSYTSER